MLNYRISSVKMQCTMFLIAVAALLGGMQCSKILIVSPTAAPSHYILTSALARGLAEAGHNITMISAFGEKTPPKNSTYRDIVLTGFLEARKNINMNMFKLENLSPFLSLIFVSSMGFNITRKTFDHPKFQNLINSDENFDAVIVEVFNTEALYGLGYHFKAPLILFSTIGSHQWVNSPTGNPSPTSYVPEVVLEYSSDMTFWQRLVNWSYKIVADLFTYYVCLPRHNALMKSYLPDVPDLSVVHKNASIVLLNSHQSINQAVPRVPNMIDIGGFHVGPAKPLPRDLKSVMDEAKDGVVYFSMGSNIKPSDMPEEKRQAILTALGKIKQKVLWKWNEETMKGQPDNVKLYKWLPQQDVLAHPNMRLFITHGGLLSTMETIYHGVPILSFPIFGDQKANAARAEMNGFGLTLPFSEITEEKLTAALDELLNKNKYRENARRRSKLMRDRPVQPMDLARYWVEFVIRHQGAPHLRVAGLDLPWYKYLLIDVVFFVALVGVGSVVALYVIVRRICCRRKTKDATGEGKKNEHKLKIN